MNKLSELLEQLQIARALDIDYDTDKFRAYLQEQKSKNGLEFGFELESLVMDTVVNAVIVAYKAGWKDREYLSLPYAKESAPVGPGSTL